MPSSPEVSIVMPVYNADRYLTETIESVLSQTFRNWELVVVDDGSTDGSLDILRQYARQDNRIRIVSRPRTGIAGARNDGIAGARADLIACMDNDDLMTPDRLERQVAYMRQHPDCVMLGGAALLIDPDGDPLIERHCPTEHADIEAELLQGRNPMIQPAVMLRRAAVLSVGGYRDECNFAEDFDLFLRLSERGHLAALPEILLKHREHMARASYAMFRQQRRVVESVLREAYQRRGLTIPLPPVPPSWHPETRRGFHIRCCSDAFDGGHLATARKHARALFKSNPFSLRAWDLMARTFLDRRAYQPIATVKKWLRPLKNFRKTAWSKRSSPPSPVGRGRGGC